MDKGIEKLWSLVLSFIIIALILVLVLMFFSPSFLVKQVNESTSINLTIP